VIWIKCAIENDVTGLPFRENDEIIFRNSVVRLAEGDSPTAITGMLLKIITI